MLSAGRIFDAGCRSCQTILRSLLSPESSMFESRANFKVSFSPPKFNIGRFLHFLQNVEV